MSDGLPAVEYLPRLDDLVHIGAGAGGIYEYDEMAFRVVDAAALPDGYVALTGWELPKRDEDGCPIEPLRQLTVLARRTGVTIIERAGAAPPEPAPR